MAQSTNVYYAISTLPVHFGDYTRIILGEQTRYILTRLMTLPEMAFEADTHICERYYRTQLEGAPVDPGYAVVERVASCQQD